MRTVLVSHPHSAAVSVAAARAFARSGRLAGFVTGVGAADGTWTSRALRVAARTWPQLSNRILQGIPSSKLTCLGPVEMVARSIAMLGRPAQRARRTYDLLFQMHDAAVAASTWPRGTIDTVYAYEDAAQLTFVRAGRLGAAKILDLPAAEAAAQETVWRTEGARWPQAAAADHFVESTAKRHRKRTEIEHADVICVASSFTRSTLVEAGVRTPVVVAPYGFPVELFAEKAAPNAGPFTVLSVGAHDLRKGTPYLLEAWKKAALKDARLVLVGPIRLNRGFVAKYRGQFEHVPYVARADLARHYQQADLLLFPTLCDGFGLVIQEAMCCGTPVLTTRCSGGPECFDDDVEGWLVPPRDVSAIVDRLRWAAAHRDELAMMGRASSRRAHRWDHLAAGGIIHQTAGGGARIAHQPSVHSRASLHALVEADVRVHVGVLGVPSNNLRESRF